MGSHCVQVTPWNAGQSHVESLPVMLFPFLVITMVFFFTMRLLCIIFELSSRRLSIVLSFIIL